MSNPRFFFCSQPCSKYFKKESHLLQHRPHSTLCLARWNARLSEATQDLHKRPQFESNNLYTEEQDLPGEDNEIPQDESPVEDSSSTTSDEGLEQAPVP